MGLLDDLGEEANFLSYPGSRCSVCEMMSELPSKERELLQSRLNDRRITGAAITKVLRANGFAFSDGTIQRHRRGNCRGLIG